jgi:hypothetical protein
MAKAILMKRDLAAQGLTRSMGRGTRASCRRLALPVPECQERSSMSEVLLIFVGLATNTRPTWNQAKRQQDHIRSLSCDFGFEGSVNNATDEVPTGERTPEVRRRAGSATATKITRAATTTPTSPSRRRAASAIP